MEPAPSDDDGPGQAGARLGRRGGRARRRVVVPAEAVLRLTGVAGRGRGTLLALDDLHEADPETLGVLEYLVDNLDLQPTVLLGVIRTPTARRCAWPAPPPSMAAAC